MFHNKELMKQLEKEMDDVKHKISELRKKGIITKTVEYMLGNIPSKIQMAGVTNSEKDVAEIRNVFEKCFAELDFLENEFMEEEKKLEYMSKLLHKANEYLQSGNLRECVPLYNEIRDFYEELSIESRYKVYHMCVDFYAKFQNLAKA
jgi:hypothetical protein